MLLPLQSPNILGKAVLQSTIETVVEKERFSMPTLYELAWPLIEQHSGVAGRVDALHSAFGERYRRLGYTILRHVFLIELVKVPKIETTKVRVRWYPELEGDQRFCSFQECLDIASDLVETLLSRELAVPLFAEAMSLLDEVGILPYESPIDYQTRPLSTDTQTRIHRRGNVIWLCDETMMQTLRLRKRLTSPTTSPDAAFFRRVLDDKVKIKTYLTDRVLTGEHKTNREKRWEVHPRSVHFALRRSCMAIEHVLLTQVCAFEGFPENFRAILQAQEKILPGNLPTYCCPITLEPMSFSAFRDELMNPVHGKSNFQVGHLNPLKLDSPNDQQSGHTAENIGWISAHGNRIQGSLGLADVRDLLRRISLNYESRGWA